MSLKAAQKTEVDALLERVLAFDNPADRQKFVKEHPAADWNALLAVLAERVWQEVRVDTVRAERLADTAIEIAEVVGDHTSLGKSLRAKANALYALDHHVDALKFHEKAVSSFERANDQPELARTLSSSIQPMLLLGRYDEAFAAGERARKIFQAQGNAHRLARLEINIANIYHRQDRFTEAAEVYERAYRELLPHGDTEGLAAVLSNLSLCYISLNDFPRALKLHSMARRQCEKAGMPILVAYADYNIAYLYFLRGEFGRAIQMLRDAATSAKKAPDAYQLALCNLDLSEIYLELNLNSEAAELGRAAHLAFAELGFGYEAAKALAFTAIASSRIGQAFEAIKLFAQSKEIFVRERNEVWPSLIDLYEALVLFNEGRLFEAQRLCMGAHEFFECSPMRGKAVLAGLLLARICLRMGDLNSARRRGEAARAALEKLDSPLLSYQTEFCMGEIERASANIEQAYTCYSRAREAVEQVRGRLRGEELKIAFFQNKLEVYENLVDLCLRRPDRLEEAFQYVEQAKSRALVDLLSASIHAPHASDPGQSELVRSIRNSREELNWYYNLIEREQLRPEERSQERIKQLEQQARAREAELLRALKEATVAEAHEAGLYLPLATSFERIRASLSPDTALVEYFRIQDRILVCVLRRDALHIIPVTVHSRIQKLLQLLQLQMSKFRLSADYLNTFSEPLRVSTEVHLKNLYQELIAPVRHWLDTRHLVFVPHGVLHYLPFHALHDGESYLIDQYEISYAPSASVYVACQDKQVNQDGGALLLGISDAQAPLIKSEVEALKSIIPNTKLFVGEDATESVLRSHGRESRLVHIATHGYFRQDNPMFSSIRLGDTHLSLCDLAHFHIPAELVVLSGCATGLNVVAPGDELMGLVRGLLQAGARSLILSLWDVHDESTRDFMIGFYSRWQQGLSKAKAIQAAMLELRQHHPHPYHWAPFSLIGKE
jgi:CHAT domain-containing protein/tetratricopeptide (TPR) repeat protein